MEEQPVKEMMHKNKFPKSRKISSVKINLPLHLQIHSSILQRHEQLVYLEDTSYSISRFAVEPV